MSDLTAVLEHLLEIKATNANIDARLGAIEKAVMGNGQPGLAQKVADLEGSRNKMWGVISAVGGLGGAWEAISRVFHWKF